MQFYFKHSIFVLVTLAVALDVNAQSANNQAIVTIIGDPVQSNSYAEVNDAPPVQQQIKKTIEPTLENGFHMRFEVGSPQYVNHGGTSSYSSSGYVKPKKHTASMTERSFNAKKRFRSWLPTHKKKYRPHLCGRF
ncbi:MAG: hypothetical protein ACT4ON_16395 [Bacteroidota bacterium]